MALQTQMVSSLEGGKVEMFITYDDSDGRIRRVSYKNETPYPTFLTVVLPQGNPREFPFPPSQPYTEIDVPANARPNITFDELQLQMGFSQRARGR